MGYFHQVRGGGGRVGRPLVSAMVGDRSLRSPQRPDPFWAQSVPHLVVLYLISSFLHVDGAYPTAPKRRLRRADRPLAETRDRLTPRSQSQRQLWHGDCTSGRARPVQQHRFLRCPPPTLEAETGPRPSTFQEVIAPPVVAVCPPQGSVRTREGETVEANASAKHLGHDRRNL